MRTTRESTGRDAAGPALRVCMIAAENDALPGGKVGGMGDVLRDAPAALAGLGADITVVLPCYGRLHRLPTADRLGILTVRFGQFRRRVEAFTLPDPAAPAVRLVVLQDVLFSPCGEGRVYCDDPADAPFATDASKYALFCAAAAELLVSELLPRQDVLHLHDWHSGFLAILREGDPAFARLRDARLVFSIHNLALQGIRPFEGHASSLLNWYPWLSGERARLADPRWKDCVNPMAAAIRMADRVHAVSPTYATEIVQPSAPERGFHGGEGLEQDLAEAAGQGRLVGILNGIAYPVADQADAAAVTPLAGKATVDATVATGHDGVAVREHTDAGTAWRRWMRNVADDLLAELAHDDTLRAVDYVAHQRALDYCATARPAHVLTSVGRLVEQKVALLLQPLQDGRSALEHLLERHADDAVLLLAGSGDVALERAMQDLAVRCPNLLFINRYAAGIAESLYERGDLFLMPSSFEPCGISQMLAMRAGQPCLVHAVGGLVDTVHDGVDGFHFSGTSRLEQASAMMTTLDTALERHSDAAGWRVTVATARARRFDWQASARRYLEELYRP